VPFLEWLRLVYKVALSIIVLPVEYTAEIIANIVQLFKVDYTTTILNDLQDEILQSKKCVHKFVCSNTSAFGIYVCEEVCVNEGMSGQHS